MNTIQVVIITLLMVVGFGLLCSLLVRMTDLEDNIWVEPVLMAVVGLFIYLVAR